ncbi:MAG: hypothetical protein KDK65_03300, partial [Chlamydiia bacterium]|nr:hypothetical protein [Chlamydiia bacterium]
KTFLKCSTDFEYCWNLLQKLPPPVFFSQGETTYSYLTEKPVTAETRSIEEKAQEALKLISEGNAAIRLLNTQPEKFGFEMKMINDPVFMRPIRRVYGQRDWVLNDRANGNMVHRGFKQRQSLRTQLQTPQQPSSTLWPAVHHDGDRGKAKLTEDTKKVSFTMLRRDAQIVHFKGEIKEYTSYRPVGILVEVDETNPKNQKFVFNSDAATSYKFWVGENANQMVGTLRGRNSNLTIADLRNELDEQIHTGKPPEKVAFYEMQHANNEILMPYRKSAIKAMFATEDTAESRVRTFLHTVYLAQDYGKKVPVLVIDGEKQPRAYTFDDLYADLVSSKLSLGLRHDLEACFFSSLDHANNEELLEHCKTLYQSKKS